MEEFIARLLDLQDLDRKIDRLKADVDSIPAEMGIHSKETEAHQAKFAAFQQKMESVQQEQKKLASVRTDQQTRISDYKSRLLSLKSNEEYSAMLNQISHAEKMIDQIDSRILEAMYQEDEAAGSLERAEKERDRAVRRSQARGMNLKEKLSQLQIDLAELEKERIQAADRVDPKYLRMYEKARTSGHREAVTGLKEGACGSCLTKIPPQSAGEIKGGRTFSCPICGSFVVWTEDSSL